MKNLELKNWMFTGLNGLLAIMFGLIAISFPGLTLIALAIYFAISILLGGLLLTIGSIRKKNNDQDWQLVMLEGVIGIILGSVILMRPEVSAAVFVTIMGAWAILSGIVFLFAGIRRMRPKPGRSFLLITGISSLIFGILISLNPFEGSRVITVLIGVYAIAYGLFSMINNNRIF